MDIFSTIFGSDANDVRRSHVKNLVSIALADGLLTDEEWQLLVFIASKLGLSEEEIKVIKNNPESVNFTSPKSYEDRVQQIEDLVAVITIDHDINSNEIDLCKKISLKLDVLPQIVDSIISSRR